MHCEWSREMADADYGYVGGAPGKIDLYKGHVVRKRNVPQSEAVSSLIQLIKEEGIGKSHSPLVLFLYLTIPHQALSSRSLSLSRILVPLPLMSPCGVYRAVCLKEKYCLGI